MSVQQHEFVGKKPTEQTYTIQFIASTSYEAQSEESATLREIL